VKINVQPTTGKQLSLTVGYVQGKFRSMKNPKIKTKVVHSLSNSAWNVIGTTLGAKYKIARVPYLAHEDKEIRKRECAEALQHAEFISHCFNNSEFICAADLPCT